MKIRVLIIYTIIFLFSALANAKVFIIGSKNNIFTLALKQQNEDFTIVSDIDQAFNIAKRGDGIIITAPGYPDTTCSINKDSYDKAESKGIRLFVEFPSTLPHENKDGHTPIQTYSSKLERGIIVSPIMGIEPLSIVGINDCKLIKAECSTPIMVLGKVAGYDKAIFGINDVKTYPLLYRDNNSLIATTSFSNCIKGRYAPQREWSQILSYILGWVLNKDDFTIKELPSDPRPAYTRNKKLPRKAKRNAVISAANWLWKANLFIHPSWEKELMRKYQVMGGNCNRFFGEPITDKMLQGNGSRGIMEGHASNISSDGSQEYRYFIRADVQGESAMLLAAAAQLSKAERYHNTSVNLLDYLFHTSDFRDGEGGERCKRSSVAYGLLGWGNTHQWVFYNDDNARCILGAIGAAAMLDNSRWNLYIVENILAMLRLCSEDGFFGARLELADLNKNGWEYYADRKNHINPSPHFESWMWACFLWLYDKTGYEPLLEKAKRGITHMMEIYPNWKAQNGIQQERARMILPLAWLVRVEDTPKHREWLDIVVKKFLENQDKCGAIREELSTLPGRQNLLVTSNARYGLGEASLIAQNGDPVADMLYTCNFGFFALNEAYKATGKYKEALESLADFLIRIQVKSDKHEDLDGCWFRAFDYERWDYWASNADDGWGAWCTLTGWIESWIGVTEKFVDDNSCYWDITKNMEMKSFLNKSLWLIKR